VGERTSLPVCDADSHLMEPPGWLEGYADPGIRKQLGPVGLVDSDGRAKVSAAAERRLAGEEPAAEALLKSDPSYSMQKGWMGLGAMEGSERGELLDLMGVSYQLVFPTLAMSQFARTRDLDLLYGGSTALNRGMTNNPDSDDASLFYQDPPYNTYAKWSHEVCPDIYAFSYDDWLAQGGFRSCDGTELRISFCPSG